MKSFLIFLLLFLLFQPSFSQALTDPSPQSRTNAFLEILGNGGAYSLNVERTIHDQLALRLGFGAWSSDNWGAGKKNFITVPVTGSYLLGKGKSKLELGGGFLLGNINYRSSFNTTDDFRQTIFNLTGIIGYRFQPAYGGFLARIGLAPFYSFDRRPEAYPDPGFFLSGGLSLGYSFF